MHMRWALLLHLFAGELFSFIQSSLWDDETSFDMFVHLVYYMLLRPLLLRSSGPEEWSAAAAAPLAKEEEHAGSCSHSTSVVTRDKTLCIAGHKKTCCSPDRISFFDSSSSAHIQSASSVTATTRQSWMWFVPPNCSLWPSSDLWLCGIL